MLMLLPMSLSMVLIWRMSYSGRGSYCLFRFSGLVSSLETMLEGPPDWVLRTNWELTTEMSAVELILGLACY